MGCNSITCPPSYLPSSMPFKITWCLACLVSHSHYVFMSCSRCHKDSTPMYTSSFLSLLIQIHIPVHISIHIHIYILTKRNNTLQEKKLWECCDLLSSVTIAVTITSLTTTDQLQLLFNKWKWAISTSWQNHTSYCSVVEINLDSITMNLTICEHSKC